VNGAAQQLSCREVTLPATRPAASVARQATRAAMAAWRLSYLADSAVLLVSELVTNAVKHAGSAAAAAATVLRLEYGGDWLRIEVHDTSPHAPRPRVPDWLDESGFGLMLVDALAASWGVRQTAQGKAVWAELDARPGGAAE
jgi:anti-sigma regulatory factor (Ser/Thr protein kinase)